MTRRQAIEALEEARGRRLLAEQRLRAAGLGYGQTGDQLDLEHLARTAREYWAAHRAVDETVMAITARRA